jgi:hypothetical protein
VENDELASVEPRPRRGIAQTAERAALAAVVVSGASFAGFVLTLGDEIALTLAVEPRRSDLWPLTAVFVAARQSLGGGAGTRPPTVFAIATNAFVAVAWLFVWVFLWSGSR